MLTQYTSEQVAKQIGYTRSRILQICKRLNLPRVGNQYVLGEEEIMIIRNALGHKPSGRPRKEKIGNDKYMCINDHTIVDNVSNGEVSDI